MDYEFTLKYKLSEKHSDMDVLVEQLAEAGCEDALIGTGQKGRVALNFTRKAPSAKEAMFSALADVRQVIPDATLVEVSPDFVGLSDAAELVGVTRQNMRKLMVSHSLSFPMPVHEGSAAIWHLATLLEWLVSRAGYQIEQRLRDTAHLAMQINLAREANLVELPLLHEVRALVA
jgi:hypothetical protein